MVAHLANSPDFVHVPFQKIMAEDELRDVSWHKRSTRDFVTRRTQGPWLDLQGVAVIVNSSCPY